MYIHTDIYSSSSGLVDVDVDVDIDLRPTLTWILNVSLAGPALTVKFWNIFNHSQGNPRFSAAMM